MQIQGNVVYQDIATGCWGIIDDQQKKWRVVEMPQPLQKIGLKVKVRAEQVQESFSVFMWGKPIRVLDYETL